MRLKISAEHNLEPTAIILNVSRANRMAGRLWDLLAMLEVKALPFVIATDLMAQLYFYRGDQKAQALDPVAREHIRTVLIDLQTQLVALEASRPTIASLDRLLALLDDERWSLLRMGEGVSELRDRLFDDLGNELLLSLNRHERVMYEAHTPWGDELALRFPSLQDEVREASKCLALGRYTAAAFHSLRCLEGGIVAMSRCLGIPDPIRGHERNWSSMLGKIDKERKSRWSASALLSGDGHHFDELYGALAGMQNPWRNATMHLEQTFNEEQAVQVFNVVGAFMRRVADRMDEDGLPLA